MKKISPISPSPVHSFTRNMLLDLRAIISDAYAQAASECYDNHSAPSARDLLPHKRKALIDDKLSSFATKYGIVPVYKKNKIKTCNHIELFCRDQLFVIYYVPSKGERPKTEYRKDLAMHCELLLPGLESIMVRPGKEYIEILHGPDGKELDKLGFIKFVKPSPYMAGDVWVRDLNELLATEQVHVENIVDNAPVKLRRPIKKTEEE